MTDNTQNLSHDSENESQSLKQDSNSINNNLDEAPQLVVEKAIVGSIDHLAISKSLGYQIFRKDRRNAWTSEEDKCLKELLIKQYLHNTKLSKYNNEQIDIKQIDWLDIANKMKTKRKGKECKKRWVSSLDPFLRKGKWTPSEDELLIKAFKKHGTSWQKVASEIEGRNEDQCSKRYTEVLNSDTKERLKPWNIEEDLILIEQVKQFGTKWRQISSSLPTRPSLTCRNRWRKIMTDIAKDSASDIIKKAVGVLDETGRPIVKFKKVENLDNETKENNNTNKNINDIKTNKKRIRDSNDSGESINENIEKANNANNNANNVNNNNSNNNDNNSNNDTTNKNTDNNNEMNHNNNDNDNDNIKSSKRMKRQDDNYKDNKNNRDLNFNSNISSYQRIVTPSRTQTDWSFSLVDPHTNEEMKSYSGMIENQNLAHYLIELAKFNGVTLTVHQHIHHHYSSGSSNVAIDPQSNISRYGHFNYLPPLTEVPKLTSSSSPDNTADSNNSNKNYAENSLLRLLNNEDMNNNGKNKSKIQKGNSSLKNNNESSSSKSGFYISHRQQLYPSNSSYNNTNSPGVNSPSTNFQNDLNNDKDDKKDDKNTYESNNESRKNITEGIEEELDFWETMRAMNYSKNNKPVSQHHPLHYNQPSNYKEQLPYQPSDSFGIQRFPNMATPFGTNMINNDGKNTQTNITSINTDGTYGGMYIGAQDDDADEEEEEEMDIANQYGMYYSVFANKGGQSVDSNYGRTIDNNNMNSGATGLVNSGYLMPFNPS